jgi:hypothetical protein
MLNVCKFEGFGGITNFDQIPRVKKLSSGLIWIDKILKNKFVNL